LTKINPCGRENLPVIHTGTKDPHKHVTFPAPVS